MKGLLRSIENSKKKSTKNFSCVGDNHQTLYDKY